MKVLLLILCCSISACTVDVQPAPIEVDEITISVEVTATLSCNEYSLSDYLEAGVCEVYNPDECCNLMWDDIGCWISFCDDGCIGLTEECYGNDQEN